MTPRALPRSERDADAAGDLTVENYRFLQQYIHRESGIALGDDKQYLLRSRLVPLLESESLGSLDALCARLKNSPAPDLRRRVVESLTTHETLFFRDPAVFDALRSTILPELVRERQSARTLRIWSAACSSGQEAYSLAMLLLESGYGDWNLEIHGTDLSGQVVERARSGRFLQIEVNRGLPAALLVKYFRRAGLDWQIADIVKRAVRFTTFDLRDSMNALGPFDLVLCRNVLIYFDVDTRKKILAGLASRLIPGGYLLLGASETTFQLDNRFQRKSVGNVIVYQIPTGAPKR
jgi:chemotaxis protein methyltransferase CheR